MITEFFSFIPAAFPALALAHFLALLSPGPDFFLIIGHAVRHRLRGAVFICLGIALGNALYIALAGAGWAALRHSPLLYLCMELAGAAYMIWMGWMLLQSSRQARKARPAKGHKGVRHKEEARAMGMQEQAALSPSRQLIVGLGSALLNPKNAVFYLTLMTVILGPETTLGQQFFVGIWMTTLVFMWDAGVARLISLPNLRQRLWEFIPLIEGVAGGVLMVLAGMLVIVPFFSTRMPLQ